MVELAEDEMSNFVKVWLSIFVCLSYCYIIGNFIPKGLTRLLAILPVIAWFLVLPLKLTSIHFCGLISFIISWLANFKLLLFAFGKPPLRFDPPISYPHFLMLACLPIKIQEDPSKNYANNSHPSPQKLENSHKISTWNYIIKGTLLALIVKSYDYSDQIPENLLWLILGFQMYFTIEISLACFATAAYFLLGFELEPQFNEPLLSTSLQDFWGRRWNLMVTSILRPSVYLPTIELSTKLVGKQMAKLLGVMATFVVSAIMHELIFFHVGRVSPTFEVTCFFLLHGFCLCVEMSMKKLVGSNLRVPRWLSGIATVCFVMGTGFWLFLPSFWRGRFVERALEEYAAIGALSRV